MGKRELIRQYNSALYERIAISKNKKAVKQLGRKGQIIEEPLDAIKDHTVLEFLSLKEHESYSESDLENAIISKLEHFMMELGKGFLFEGRQKRFAFEGDSFYVDLVFYNRLLKCYSVKPDTDKQVICCEYSRNRYNIAGPGHFRKHRCQVLL